MTWVIGRAGPFGHAIGISDVRVTLGNGTEVDCLQKIYNIAPRMVLGFAGSVAIGFEVVQELSFALSVTDKSVLNDPLTIANHLDIGTRELFKNADEKQRNLGCQLILLSVHPKENLGSSPWAQCYIHRFYAPDFKPQLTQSSEIVSIGSGARIDEYSKILQSVENNFETFKFEMYMEGGLALGIMASISSAIRKRPVKGISSHLQMCIVGRDITKIGNNNVTNQENPKDNFIMPELATSMEELHRILSRANFTKSAIEHAKC